jgi:hypothetical protein
MVGKDGEEAARATIDSTLPNPRLTSGQSTWKWTSVLKKIFLRSGMLNFLLLLTRSLSCTIPFTVTADEGSNW